MTDRHRGLAAKVSTTTGDMSDIDRRLADAEARIEAAAEGFVEWAVRDLADAQATLDRLERGEGDGQSVRSLFRIVHDIKGQGGTFGYDLATRIAAPMCDFLRPATKPPSATQLAVIKGHLMALEMVIGKGIKGDGEGLLQGIVEKLARARDGVPPLD